MRTNEVPLRRYLWTFIRRSEQLFGGNLLHTHGRDAHATRLKRTRCLNCVRRVFGFFQRQDRLQRIVDARRFDRGIDPRVLLFVLREFIAQEVGDVVAFQNQRTSRRLRALRNSIQPTVGFQPRTAALLRHRDAFPTRGRKFARDDQAPGCIKFNARRSGATVPDRSLALASVLSR